MSENAKDRLERIGAILKELPPEIAKDAQNQYAAHMEGYAEGFAAGKSYTSEKKGE